VFVGPMEPAWWSNDFVFLLVFHYAMNYIYSTIYFNFLFWKIEIKNYSLNILNMNEQINLTKPFISQMNIMRNRDIM
jgi:hypothetical protein